MIDIFRRLEQSGYLIPQTTDTLIAFGAEKPSNTLAAASILLRTAFVVMVYAKGFTVIVGTVTNSTATTLLLKESRVLLNRAFVHAMESTPAILRALVFIG